MYILTVTETVLRRAGSVSPRTTKTVDPLPSPRARTVYQRKDSTRLGLPAAFAVLPIAESPTVAAVVATLPVAGFWTQETNVIR